MFDRNRSWMEQKSRLNEERIERRMENQDWQPIETAPKDQFILAYDPEHSRRMGYPAEIPVVAYWCPAYAMEAKPFWKILSSIEKINPTHWKPADCPKVGE